MRQLTEWKAKSGPNAWGATVSWDQAEFELEASDVGRVLHNYLGFRKPGLIISHAHVGKKIIKTRDVLDYNCWYFDTRTET